MAAVLSAKLKVHMFARSLILVYAPNAWTERDTPQPTYLLRLVMRVQEIQQGLAKDATLHALDLRLAGHAQEEGPLPLIFVVQFVGMEKSLLLKRLVMKVQ